jgi:hypothetical protein
MGLSKTLAQLMDCPLPTHNTQIIMTRNQAYNTPTSCCLVIIICGLFVGKGQSISCANVLLNPIAVLFAIK